MNAGNLHVAYVRCQVPRCLRLLSRLPMSVGGRSRPISSLASRNLDRDHDHDHDGRDHQPVQHHDDDGPGHSPGRSSVRRRVLTSDCCSHV